MNSICAKRRAQGRGKVVIPTAGLLLAMALGLSSSQGRADPPVIKLITEHSALTSTDQSGGEATQFVQQVLAAAGITPQLIYLPWRRAYNYASTQNNAMIFPLARTPKREASFQWVGQLIPVNYYLFRLKSRRDIVVNTLDDSRKYRIGVVNYHVHHEYLLAQNFTGLQPVNGNAQNLKKALLERIDLFPISDGGLLPVCQRENIDCSKFEPVLKLEDISGGLYMAYSTSTDEVIVNATRDSYQQLVTDGSLARVLQTRLDYIDQFNAMWPLTAEASSGDSLLNRP